MLNDKIDNISNIPELETLGIKDTAIEGHAVVKVPVKFFSALWYYTDIAHTKNSKGWKKFCEIVNQYYNEEDLKGSLGAVRALERTIKSDKELKAAIQTLKYIIENTTDFDKEYVYPLEADR